MSIAEPLNVYQGDSLSWSRADLVDYPASAWTLTYYFTGAGGAFSIVATPDGDDFDVAATIAETLAWPDGFYSWQARVDDGADAKQTVDSGRFEVLLGFDGAMASDQRSHNRIMVAALEAMLQGKATRDQKSYKLPDGRELERLDLTEIADLLDLYTNRLRREEAVEDAAAGRATSGRQIRARL